MEVGRSMTVYTVVYFVFHSYTMHELRNRSVFIG